MMNISKKMFAILLVAMAASVAVRAEHFSIKTADGYLHVYNGKDASFTIEIRGKDIKPQQVAGNPAFAVDGALVQLLVVKREHFDPGKKAVGTDIMTKHREWELDYLKEVFDSVPKATSKSVKLAGRDHLIWGFTRPKHAIEFDRDHFITTVVGDDIVGLSSPVTIGHNIDVYEKRFAEIMTSMRISKEPFDVQKLADDIRKGARQAK
jgi:hypothetical protein